MSNLDKTGARHNRIEISLPDRPEVADSRNVHNKRVGKLPVNESKTSLPNRSEVSEKVPGDRHVWGDGEHKHLRVAHFQTEED
jgi:hypothetical protein